MNIIFERPTLNRTTDKENIALIDRWIADTVDKLNIDPELGSGGDVPTKLSELEDDSTHRTVTDAEKASWNSKPSSANVYQTTDATATTIDDADYVPFSSTSGKRKITLTNIKAKLKTYFDTLYAAISHTHTKSQITDFPTLGTAAAKDVPASGNASTTQVVMGDDTRLTDSRTPTSHTHTKSQITDFPTLAAVATSGSYDDLIDEPINQTADQYDTTVSLCTRSEKYRWNEAYYDYLHNSLDWYSGSANVGATSVSIEIGSLVNEIVCLLAEGQGGSGDLYNQKTPLKYKSVEFPRSGNNYNLIIRFPSALTSNTDFQVATKR